LDVDKPDSRVVVGGGAENFTLAEKVAEASAEAAAATATTAEEEEEEGAQRKSHQHYKIKLPSLHNDNIDFDDDGGEGKDDVEESSNGKNNRELWFDEDEGRFYEASSEKETIPLSVIFERTVDTVEDAVLHARRIPYEKGWIEKEVVVDRDRDGEGGTEGREDKRQTVVVLGSGWASHALSKVADTYKMRLIVVSPVNQ
jgi:hypothetical protein